MYRGIVERMTKELTEVAPTTMKISASTAPSRYGLERPAT